jgi:hypothetical protein
MLRESGKLSCIGRRVLTYLSLILYSLKENVIFGREYDEKKYWEVVKLGELPSLRPTDLRLSKLRRLYLSFFVACLLRK